MCCINLLQWFYGYPSVYRFVPQPKLYDGDTMKLVIDDMLANKLLQTWTNLELYELYTWVMTLWLYRVYMEGCVSVVGFSELVGKSLKLVNDESVDEESFSSVIRQVRSEARAVHHSNATYDMGDFTWNNTI